MDVTRAQSGIAIEGAFSAIWLFGQKLANALAPAVLGLILAQAGWVEATGAVVAQSEQALGTLRVAITMLPAGILVVAVLGLGAVFHPALRRAA